MNLRHLSQNASLTVLSTQSDNSQWRLKHFSDVIMSAMASQITGVWIVCRIVCSGSDQRKHQSSASLVFAMGIHRWPLDSPHKGPVTLTMFPFDDIIINHGQIDCLFNKSLRITTKKTAKLHITGPTQRVDYPYKGPVMWKASPCCDDILRNDMISTW